MTDEIKMFPRGGKRSVPDNNEPAEPTLKKKVPQPAASPKPKKSTDVDHLTFQALSEGMLLLGRVKEVDDYKVMISLPQGLLATLPVTAVSQIYTQHLQSVADSEQDDGQDIPTLKDHFNIGDGVQCRITSVIDKGKTRFVGVTTCPRELNKDFPRSALKKGCLLYGTVQSMEEHGCMMDIGIPNLKAFLPTSGPPEEVAEAFLKIGKGLWCTVSSETSLDVLAGETAVVRVTADDVADAEVGKHMVSSLECLRPGMKVKATVEKVLKDGLYVRCIKYKGCVYRTHVPGALKQYSPGQAVEGRILFVHPLSKVVSMSLMPGILSCVEPDDEPFNGIHIGDVVEDAEVMFVDKASAVFFKFQNCTGLAPRQHLSDKNIKDVNRAFPQGSKHKCRVTGFQPADDVVLVSLKESIMKQKILSIQDIEPGQIVECTVKAIHPNGVIVQLKKGLSGFIPKLHVADVPLKNFDKKFSLGEKLKCRVLKVDVEAKKVLLTKKKSLVTSSAVPTSYQGLKSCMLLEGFVIAVKDSGIAVGFCNDVKGWVPRQELSSVEIAHPETAFYQGQVLSCRVLSCQPDAQKLRLSLIISGKAAIASNAEKMEDFEVGKMVEARVIKKMGKHFEVELQPSGTKALLPMEHLSDSPDNQNLMWQSIQPRELLDPVMLLKQTNVPIVTLKESFLSAAREGLIPKQIKDLEPGQLLPGVIRNHQSYGVFVELPGGMSGLAPLKLTMDRPAPDLSKVFARGQSVVVKVIEVDEDKGRFLCSLRMCDCYHDNPNVGVEMLETYLNERDHYLDCMLNKEAEGLKMGSLVKVSVKQKAKEGYICETSFGMSAVIARSNIGEAEIQTGTEVEAVVLHIAVDQSNCCLELSADHDLVRAVSRRVEKPSMDKARPGQVVKGNVALIREDFVLVTLKQHAVGMMALLPRKQHLNDVLAQTTSNLAVGEEIKVAIQKCEGDRVLAILASLAKEEEAHPRHTLQMGQMVSAKIQSILPGQMNIKIGKVNARVHNTEVVDEPENGAFAFHKYSKGQEIKVKIIGFRHYKSFKYLPISHPRLHKALPECTLKPSKIKKDGCPAEDQASYDCKYEPGDKVLVFVIKFEKNKLWVNVSTTQRGVLSVFDLSKDLGYLMHAEKHFTAGHGYMATVLGVEDQGLIHLSLTGRKEIVKRNKVVTGKVTSVSDHGLAMRLPGGFRGMVPAHSEESKNWRHVAVGSFLRCLVLCCKDKENCVLSRNLSHRSEEELKKVRKAQNTERKRKSSETETSPPKRRKSETDVEESVTKESAEDVEVEEEVPAEETETEKRLTVTKGFNWDQTSQSSSNSDDESDEDEENDDQDKPSKKRKKAGSAALTDGSTTQEDKPDFAKLLAGDPNNSKMWIQYMCDQVNEGNVDKARSLGNIALQTIAMEEEQEKVNIQIAMLNLEHQYGTKEEVLKILDRLKVTDHLQVHQHASSMFSASGDMEEAENIHKTIVRKFKQNRQVWIDYALFLYKKGQEEAARKLLQRALLSIDRKDHVTLITQFASLECKHGVAERGFTMFDKIMAEFPKRTDVLTVYTDMVIMQGNFDKARELFERTWALKATPRLFKKYLQFEQKHGTEETLARLQARIEEGS